EMQVPIFREGQMTPDPVYRDAQELCLELLELGEHLLVQSHLVGADGAPVLRVKGQDHGLTPELGERYGPVGPRRKFEVGRSGPRRQRRGTMVDTRGGHI